MEPIQVPTPKPVKAPKVEEVPAKTPDVQPEVVAAAKEKPKEEPKVEETKEEVKEKKQAAKQAAKAKKAVKRLNQQVSRLLTDISGLMDQLQTHKQKVQEKLESEIQAMTEEEKLARIEELKIDQQRMVGVESVMSALEKLQEQDPDKDPEARERWQKILAALDEDKDGQIELKHILGVSRSGTLKNRFNQSIVLICLFLSFQLLEILEGDKDGIHMSSLPDTLEMLDQEDIEREEALIEDKAPSTPEPTPECGQTAEAPKEQKSKEQSP